MIIVKINEMNTVKFFVILYLAITSGIVVYDVSKKQKEAENKPQNSKQIEKKNSQRIKTFNAKKEIKGVKSSKQKKKDNRKRKRR